MTWDREHLLELCDQLHAVTDPATPISANPEHVDLCHQIVLALPEDAEHVNDDPEVIGALHTTRDILLRSKIEEARPWN